MLVLTSGCMRPIVVARHRAIWTSLGASLDAGERSLGEGLRSTHCSRLCLGDRCLLRSVSRPSTIGTRLTLSIVYESLGATLQFETTRAAYSDRHDYLASMLVAFQVAMGLDDVIEGEDLVDDRVQGA